MNVDLVVAGKLAIDELTTATQQYQPVLGGSAAHFALAAATVGCRVGVVASIGSDIPPEFLDQLRAKNINLSGVVQREGRSPWFRASFAPDGSMRDYDFRFGVGNRIPLRVYNKLVLGSRAVHIGILPPHLQRKLLQRASKGERLLSMTTIAHQLRQYRTRIIPQLPMLDILFLNEEEARILSGEPDTTQAAELLGNSVPLVIVTQGEAGCLVNDQGTVFQVRGIPVPQTVDVTGAGDSFAGAFLAIYLETGDVKLATKWGNAAGALNVQTIGSTGLINATRQDLQALIS